MPNNVVLSIAGTPSTDSHLLTSRSHLNVLQSHREFFESFPYCAYIAASSDNAHLSSLESRAHGTLIEPKKKLFPLYEAQNAFIKFNAATGLPTQFTFAVTSDPNGINATIAQQVGSQFALAQASQPVTLVNENLPIRDLANAFRQAAREHNEAQSTMAACHVQLLANGKYYAHIGNMGKGMIVVVGADGNIKDQTGAMTYAIERNGVKSPYAPTPISGLIDTAALHGYQKHHLTQLHMELAPDDIVLVLTDGAWREFATQTADSSGTYTATSRHGLQTILVHQRKITLQNDALQPFVHHKSLHEINVGIDRAIFTAATRRNTAVQGAIGKIIEAMNKILFKANVHANPITLESFIDNYMSFGSIQSASGLLIARQQMKANLPGKYTLTNPTKFMLLWDDYIAPFQSIANLGPVHKVIPLNPENTLAFLKAFLPAPTENQQERFTLETIISDPQYNNITAEVAILRGTLATLGISCPDNMPLRDFLYNLCAIHFNDCSSVMVFKAPNYKTELIRSWLLNQNTLTPDHREVRANLFKLMNKAKITLQDLETARMTFAKEVFTTADITTTQRGITLNERGVLPVIQSFPNLGTTVNASEIQRHIEAINLLRLPAPLVRNDPAAPFDFTTHINAYVTCINTFKEQRIDGALFPEIPAAATEIMVTYGYEQVLPRLLAEMESYIKEIETGNDVIAKVARRQQTKEALSTLKTTSPFNIHLPNTTTWFHKNLDNRTPAQIKIDEKIKELDAQIDILQPKDLFGRKRVPTSTSGM